MRSKRKEWIYMPTRENYKTLLRIAEKDLKVAKHITTADEIYIEGVCVHCQHGC